MHERGLSLVLFQFWTHFVFTVLLRWRSVGLRCCWLLLSMCIKCETQLMAPPQRGAPVRGSQIMPAMSQALHLPFERFLGVIGARPSPQGESERESEVDYHWLRRRETQLAGGSVMHCMTP